MQDMFITPVKANPIAEDNQIFMNCPTSHFSIKKSKNTSIKFHFVQEKVENGSVEVFCQRTEEMAADIFRKALGRLKRDKDRDSLFGIDKNLSYEGNTRKSQLGC